MNLTQVDSEMINLLSDLAGEQIEQERITLQLVFLVALAMVLLGVIFADGRIEPGEEQRWKIVLEPLINEEVNQEQLTQNVIDETLKRNLYTQTKLLGTLTAPLSESEKLLLIALGYQISAADGDIHDKEKTYLEKINNLRLKIDSRYLEVLEVGFNSQAGDWQRRMLNLALNEIKDLLKPERFIELGDTFANAAGDIRKTLLSNLELPKSAPPQPNPTESAQRTRITRKRPSIP